MIEGMSDEKRHAAIQALVSREEYTENTIKPLCNAEGQVQIDSSAIANLVLHTVLNQLTIMGTLKAMLLKDGEEVMELPAAEPEPEQN